MLDFSTSENSHVVENGEIGGVCSFVWVGETELYGMVGLTISSCHY